MKKWKHLLKTVMAVGVIAMTAVQICAAAEGTAQAAVSEVTPVSISTNEISGWPAGPESHLRQGTDGCRQRNSSVQQGRR